MNMSNVDPTRQNIIDWCQQDRIQCVEQPTNPQMVWGLSLGSISIYKQPRFPDRIYFQSTINLSNIHRTLVNQTWNNAQRNVMMFNLKKLVTQLDALLNFVNPNDELIGFHTFKIQGHTTISKADFIEKFLRMQSIHEIILNQLNLELGSALASSKNTGKIDTGR